MSEVVQRLKSELDTLSTTERAELADYLLASLGEGVEDELASAWQTEVRRRVQEIRGGKVKGTSGDQLLGEMRERYP